MRGKCLSTYRAHDLLRIYSPASYGKVINKLSKEPVRPGKRKAKKAEDTKLLGKKPESLQSL